MSFLKKLFFLKNRKNSPLVKDFKRQFNNSLKSKESALLQKLNNLAKLDFNPRIKIFEFQAFTEPCGNIVEGITLFLMDDKWNEVFNKPEEGNFTESSIEVSQKIFYIDCTFFEQLSDQEIRQIEILVQEDLTDFISNIYDRSDFSKIQEKTYFYVHDRSRTFDLKKKRYIDL